MQVTPNAVWESVRKWDNQVSSPLPKEAVDLLKRKIPFIFTSKNAAPSGSFVCGSVKSNACQSWTKSTGERKLLLDALINDNDFNIMCGTLVLRWLLEKFSSVVGGFNLGQLNKAIVGYNAGAYLRALGGTSKTLSKIPIDTTRLAGIVSSEPRNYLYKMLGVNGFLELVYKKKAI
jgi:hypothetical protein